MCEGLQKSSFRLCQILDNVRYHFGSHFESKMDPKSHCDSLWALSVAILTLLWGGGKSYEKEIEKSARHGETRVPELGSAP